MSFVVGLFGGGKSQAQQQAAAAGLNVQTSVQGKPIPLIYGTTRVASNLIWYGDFDAQQQSSSAGGGQGGVGGGGGGKGGGGSGTYTYSASFMSALCEGPIEGVHVGYVNKGVYGLPALGLSQFLGAYGQAPWGYLASQNPPIAENHTIPGSSPYQVTVNQVTAFGGDQGVTSATAVAYTQVGSAPASNQYAIQQGANNTATYIFNSGNIGANVAISYFGLSGLVTLNTTIPASAQIVVEEWTGQGSSSSDPTPYTSVGSAPSAGQYQVTASGSTATYAFNSANIGVNVTITYTGVSGQRTLNTTIPPTAQIIISLWFADGGVTASVSASVLQTSVLFTPVTGTPAGNQYSVLNGVYTFNAAQAGASVTINYYAFSGNNPDLGYSGIAYVAAANYSLGNSPQLPNFNFEVNGKFSLSITQEILGEQDIIPVAPYQLTVQFAAEFVSDSGVIDEDGNVYTKVSSSPGNQQYTESVGVYTFAAVNSGIVVNISYLANAGPDADPSLVINDLLTNEVYGIGFPSDRVGSLSTYQEYCIASGLLISPAYTTQTQSSSMIDDIAQVTNSAVVWSNGALTLVPYGDQNITANGYTYTAPSAPLFSLTDDDFEKNQNAVGTSSSMNTDPVLMTRIRTSDQLNSIKLEWLDRNNQYNPAIIEAKDQAMINTFGLRQDASRAFHMLCNGNAARISVQLQLQREAVRNTYQFTLDQRYIVLDPMDIVAISDSNLGLVNQWVRITEVTENDDLTLSVSAEEYLQGTGNAPLYTYQGNNGFNANYNVNPGNVNTPVIFEPPVQITATTDLEVWSGVSGGPLWGGCDVWISTDGNTYKLAGRISGPARQGMLTADLPSSADPDTADTLSVNLSESFGELLSGTQADADAYHTLCYVGGELISFETATLTAQYEYNLTYLRRGAYGSTIGDHPNGSQFLRLDNGVFAYSYDKSKIGTTIYLKFLSFNIYGGGEQNLADVTAYTHLIVGPPLPGTVQNFTAQQQGNVVAFAWTDLPNDVGLKGYDIAYGAIGSVWSDKTFLTEAHRGTEVSTASVPPGTWEFSIRGHDIADNLGPETLATLTMTNTSTIIYQKQEAPDFFGVVLEGFGTIITTHYKGYVIPTGDENASFYQPVSAYADMTVPPILGQAPGGSLGAQTLYVKITYLDNTGESTVTAEASLLVTGGNLLTVQADIGDSNILYQGNDGGDASVVSFNVYVGATSGSETLQNSTPIPIQSVWTMPATGLVTGASPPSMDRSGWQVFDMFCPDPTNVGETVEIDTVNSRLNPSSADVDTGYNDTLRVYATFQLQLGPGEAGPLPPDAGSVNVFTWLTGQTVSDAVAAPSPWTIGYLMLRYLLTSLDMAVTQGAICFCKGYQVTVDNPSDVENFIATIAPGGSTVTFPTQFHSPPFVEATPIGTSSLTAPATMVTAQNCVINVYDNTDTSVGGTVTITATGA
jgi:hypothetical protein